MQHILSFKFTSYLPVSSLLKTNLYTKISHPRKILLKQSYLFLTWFFYLSNINRSNKLKIATLPSSKTVFTTTKAPMAHKKNSKEQYQLQYFNFSVKFRLMLKPQDVNETLFIFLHFKQTFSFVETNLFFLKNFTLFITLNSKLYFNYWYFIARRQ